MGKSTIIGFILGIGMIILGFTMDHGNLAGLFLLSPACIVIGGTLGALTISYSVSDIAKIPKLIKEATTEPKVTLNETLELIVTLSTNVKREGILSLEKTISDESFIKSHDPLLVRGATLLMDGLDRQVLKEILDSELYMFEQVKKHDISIFNAAGGFSPTLGIIGTVMGLINVLANMGTPDELAKSIAVAFIATFYGVLLANILYHPIANKLKLRLKILRLEKEMIIDGILSINDFESPMIVKERLMPYLMFQQNGKKGAKGKPETEEVHQGREQTEP